MTRDKDNVSATVQIVITFMIHANGKISNFNRVNDVTNDVKDKKLEYSDKRL